jgi:tryptophanyl-tRNA synthetase
MSPSATAVSTRELSGITPSGPLTLGNYLGALRRFRANQDNGFYFVADLHALTVEHQPARLREQRLATAALFFAAGLDEDRATVFLQSEVPAHVELGYLLESTAHVGELSRMIQFKEKGGRPGTRASLFSYPCLMAADILLYDTDQVPVGGDQSQHVELTRDLAQRFNTLYGPTFTVPELVPEALTARVRDLADAPGVIRLLDGPDEIRRKIRRAVTDGDNRLRYDPVGQPGLANLAEITAALTSHTPEQVLAAVRSYGELKTSCAEVVVAELAPIQQRYRELRHNPDELRRRLEVGTARATEVAGRVLRRARSAIGLG